MGGMESALDMRFDMKEDTHTVQVVGYQTFVVDRRLSPCTHVVKNRLPLNIYIARSLTDVEK